MALKISVLKHTVRIKGKEMIFTKLFKKFIKDYSTIKGNTTLLFSRASRQMFHTNVLNIIPGKLYGRWG